LPVQAWKGIDFRQRRNAILSGGTNSPQREGNHPVEPAGVQERLIRVVTNKLDAWSSAGNLFACVKHL